MSTTSSCILAGVLLFAAAVHAETATLKMRFVFDGKPPVAKSLAVPPGVVPAGGPIINERLLIDPVSKGIRNVIVYVYSPRGHAELEQVRQIGETQRLTQSQHQLYREPSSSDLTASC